MKVLVAGGTGFIGAEIVSAAQAAGHDVSILSRSAGRGAGGAAVVQGDVTDPASLAGKLAGFDVVVDAVQFPNAPMENPKKGWTFERVDFGGTKNLVEAAAADGAGHFIDLSGCGAAPDGEYHWLRAKWKEEEAIKAAGIRYTIFRPSWVYGPGDVSLNRFLGFAKVLPFVPVIGNGKIRLNPVFVRDIAAHVVAATGNERAYGRTFEVGGPEVVTMDEVIRAALRVSGKKRFLFHQPKALMKAVAAVAQHVPGRPLTPDAIDFVTMDPIADTAELQATFGLPLTRMEDALASYLGGGKGAAEVPAAPAAR